MVEGCPNASETDFILFNDSPFPFHSHFLCLVLRISSCESYVFRPGQSGDGIPWYALERASLNQVHLSFDAVRNHSTIRTYCMSTIIYSIPYWNPTLQLRRNQPPRPSSPRVSFEGNHHSPPTTARQGKYIMWLLQAIFTICSHISVILSSM